MWATVLGWITKEVSGLSLKVWLYVILAFAIAGEQAWLYHKGYAKGEDAVHASDLTAYKKYTDLAAKVAQEQAIQAAKDADAAAKKIADLQKQSESDAGTIKKLSDDAKAKRATKSPSQPSSDVVCNLSDDELRNFQQLIDKANN